MAEQKNNQWHSLTATETTGSLGTDLKKGLSNKEAEARREIHGENVLTETGGQSAFVRFLLQFHQPLIYILIGAGFVTAFLGEHVDSGVIFGVVLINAIVGYLQEAKAMSAVAALSDKISHTARVIRDGSVREINSRQLVPGDIVQLQSGDKVPADLRIVHSKELHVDESALTGESLPVTKTVDQLPAETVLAEQTCMSFTGTLITSGTATGIVVETGDNTQLGHISKLIDSADVLDTPLTRRIKKFSEVLLIAILVLATLTFGIGLLRDHSVSESLMASIALAVGAIPEGLPPVVTIILAIGVSRMARQKAIIRRLPAVETLGSTTIICTDKTGTLTQNQMTVQVVQTASDTYEVAGSGYDPEGSVQCTQEGLNPTDDAALMNCLRGGVLCNDSKLFEDDNQWTVMGDPTEGALIVSGSKVGIKKLNIEDEYERLDAIPFESEYQYMATLHRTPDSEKNIAFIKGSAEKLLSRCSDALDPSDNSTPFEGETISNAIDETAARGIRVLVIAMKQFPKNITEITHSDLTEGLTFLGFQGMMDPPRDEAREAVNACQNAGIRVKMITGDHAHTARAIAQNLNINSGGDDLQVVRGAELDQLDEREFAKAAQTASVFARVTPEQKLRIVKSLQADGEIVAMTGDGVNDAPALKRADIGVAMSIGGTEVAREAAAMILTDNNFATLRDAVEEGRAIYENLIKYIAWNLPTSGGEGLVILLSVFLGVSLPILPVQILWVNMTTAVFLGLPLAFEPRESGIMEQPPRDPNLPILSRAIIFRIVMVSGLLSLFSFLLFRWDLSHGASHEFARTSATAMFVFGEMFYLLNCRSLKGSLFSVGFWSNKWIWLGSGVMLLAQLAFTYLPLMNQMFETTPLTPGAWLRIIAACLMLTLLVEIEKLIQRSMRSRRAF